MCKLEVHLVLGIRLVVNLIDHIAARAEVVELPDALAVGFRAAVTAFVIGCHVEILSGQYVEHFQGLQGNHGVAQRLVGLVHPFGVFTVNNILGQVNSYLQAVE